MEGSSLVWFGDRETYSKASERSEAKRSRETNYAFPSFFRSELLGFLPVVLFIGDAEAVMKCRLHPHEVGDGVCASCLRERLLAVVAARSAAASSPSSPEDPSFTEDQHRAERSSVEHEQPSPRALPFLRSVSPYVSRGRSDAATIGTIPDGQAGTSGGARIAGSGKFSVLSALFGHHRSEGTHRDPGEARIGRSRSWLSTLFHGGLRKRKDNKKKKLVARFFSADNPSAAPDAVASTAEAPPARTTWRGNDRGMSPDRGGSAPESGYISDSANPGGRRWRPTPSPMRRPTAEHQHHYSRGMAGFAVCLSPFTRPSLNRRRCHVGTETSGGDLPRTVSPLHPAGHASGGRPSLRRNWSRKLADLGKLQ